MKKYFLRWISCASCVTLLLLFAASLSAQPTPTTAPATVSPITLELFTPEGPATNVRQVRAVFSRDVVAFADPRVSPDLIQVRCQGAEDLPKGSARWADTKTWIYDFERDLNAGITCAFSLKEGALAFDQSPITWDRARQFTTGGPIIYRISPWPGSEIEEEQVFLLRLNGKFDRSSVLTHAYFTSEDLENKIALRIESDEVRDQILKTEYVSPEDKKFTTFVAVRARARFASKSKVNLIWGQGVASPEGTTSIQDQKFGYTVRPPFHAQLSCERTSSKAGCIPFRPASIQFSAPTRIDEAEKIRLRSSEGNEFTPQIVTDEGSPEYIHTLEFHGPFPVKSSLTAIIPETLKDDTGRRFTPDPENPLTVHVDDYPPLAKFAAPFSVVEWSTSAAVPITVRDIEPELLMRSLDDRDISRFTAGGVQSLPLKMLRIRAVGDMQQWIRMLRWRSHDQSLFTRGEFDREDTPRAEPSHIVEQRIPRPLGGKSFEVMGIPISKPGFYLLEVESPRLADAYDPRNGRFFVRSAALVTNLAPHFKWGRERSLAWVTALDSGKPLSDVQLAVSDCSGKIFWQGRSDAQGLAYVTGIPQKGEETAYCGNTSGLFLTATSGEDFSFTSTDWNEGIEPWRFNLPLVYRSSSLIAHSVMPETLLRRGSTAHLKHYLRQPSIQGLVHAPRQERPHKALFRHQGSDETIERVLQWQPNGTAESSWQIPTSAKLGSYAVTLGYNDKDSDPIPAGSFEIEDFRAPLMQARAQGPADIQVQPHTLSFDFAVSYLSGGSAGEIPVVTRTTYQPLWVDMGEDYRSYSFLSGRVREGIYRSGYADEDSSEEREESTLPKDVIRKELTLDKNGTRALEVPAIPRVTTPYQVIAELEYRDPNGEAQTVRGSARVWPSSVAIGLKTKNWTGERKKISLQAVTLSPSGAPLPKQQVLITLFRSKGYSHRKRLVGGFYAYENFVERSKVGELCSGSTDARGQFECEAPVEESGEFLIEARTTDTEGRIAATQYSTWVSGDEDWWFAQEQSDRIDLIAEKKVYEPGESATLQVRSPFREATALVSIEREGVIEASVQHVQGKEPLIHVPIKAQFAPNVFVSVFLVRGRIGDIQPTALLDLGRPAVKLGIAELKVSRRAHELAVKVHTDAEKYKVRETARAKILVSSLDGTPLARDTEIALAVIDEAVLELQDNISWDLLEAMLGRRPYQVATSSAQLQVVGKRHFGLKALPSGGGGGAKQTRELFDTLLFWKPHLKPNKHGVVEVEIPLNDSLSRFRVVAIASSGTGRFGTGHSSFTTSQDLMLLPGIAPLVREGDRTVVEATLRNTTDRAMEVSASLHAERTTRSTGHKEAFTLRSTQLGTPSQSRTLLPGASERIRWNIEVPSDTSAINYELTVEENAPQGARDLLKLSQEVHVPVRPTVLQATLQQVHNQVQIPIEMPKDAWPGMGGISVSFRPSLLEGAEGIKKFMQSYPYTCLEQNISKAVALNDSVMWAKIAEELPAYLGESGFLKYFPSMPDSSIGLTTYVLALTHSNGFKIPDPLLTRMLDALSGFVAGTTRTEVQSGSGDLTQEKIAALDAISRYRAIELLDATRLNVDLRTLPTLAAVQWWSVVNRTPKFPDRDEALRRIQSELFSRINFQGSMMMLSSGRHDETWWFMSSPDRAIVQLILAALEAKAWTSDIPKLVRGALERQRGGAWGLTTANAWGSVMLRHYSREFEKEAVSGVSTATLRSNSERSGNPFATMRWNDYVANKAKDFRDAALTPFLQGASILELRHEGSGAPWAFVQSVAAIPLKEPLSSGYQITRELIAIERANQNHWTEGDLVRVRIAVEAQADRSWVVIDDPIPAGSSIVGVTRRSASIARSDEENTNSEDDPYASWSWPVYTERSFGAHRAYYDYFPKGTTTLEYSIRLNSAGEFQLPPTRVEAMYSPEMFGELPNETLVVEAKN